MLKKLRVALKAMDLKSNDYRDTYFKIENEYLYANSEWVEFAMPIQLDFNCNPKAEVFVKTLAKCNFNKITSFIMSGTDKLILSHGGVKNVIPCIEGLVHTPPSGKFIEVDGEDLIKGIATAFKFISCKCKNYDPLDGVTIIKDRVYGLQNVAGVCYHSKTSVSDELFIHSTACKVLLSIPEFPIRVQVDSTSATFHYADRMWVKCTQHPSPYSKFQEVLKVKNVNFNKIPPLLFTALESIRSDVVSTDKRVYLSEGLVSVDSDGSNSTCTMVPGLHEELIINIDLLLLLKDIANAISVSNGGKVEFKGVGVEGIIMRYLK